MNQNTYQLIANIISKTYPIEGLRDDLMNFNNWEGLVKLGSQQLIIPAIYWSLKQKELLNLIPNDLSLYLEEIFQINENRNKSLKLQLTALDQLFRKHNIQYTLIKGCALLQHLSETELGIRMIGDIDVLIVEYQIHKAYNILKENGYKEGNAFNYELKGFRHLSRLVHDNFIAAVEIHRSVLNASDSHYMPNERIFKNLITNSTLVYPSKKVLALIIIYSAQINDHHDYYNTPNFRAIYDCLLLNVNKNTDLIKELQNSSITHSFMGYAQFFLDDYKSLQTFNEFNICNSRIMAKFKYPHFNKIILRIKWTYLNISKRITIFTTNASYRRHVLKNKIFPFFN